MRGRSIAGVAVTPAALLAIWLASSARGADPLLDRLTIVAPASLGGGWDQTARAMQKALVQSGLVGTVDVRNSPGAGGAVGLAQFVSTERGHGDALILGGLLMMTAERASHAAVSIMDTTPVARLTGDYEVLAVPGGSDLATLDDLVQALRVEPGAISWAGGSVGGTDQLLVTSIARAIGVDPVRMNYVAFTGGGEVAQALLDHEVSAGVSGYAELAAHFATGRIRPLAVASEQRLAGVAIPTLRELGVDVTLMNWRGVFGPPGITSEQRGRLVEVTRAMVGTDAWRDTLAQYHWKNLFLTDTALARFLDAERARAAALPDPRGTQPTRIPRAVWTGEMRLLRNRRAFASVAALAALLAAGLIVWQRAAAARREKELFKHLEDARQDASARGAEVQSLLRGLSEQIDRQFAEWGLTPAEREVALLTLKGLRHKEIAAARATTERTVRQQALTIYKKAGLDGRTDLAAFFLEDLLGPGGLTPAPPAPERPKRPA